MIPGTQHVRAVKIPKKIQKTLNRLDSKISNLLYNRQEPDPKKEEELLKALAHRNEFLYTAFQDYVLPEVIESIESANSCEVLASNTDIPLEYRAYHLGPMLQSRLVPKPYFKDTAFPPNHVFFTSLPLDIGEWISSSTESSSPTEPRIVYVADVREMPHLRVQTEYGCPVLFNDKLDTLVQCYNDPRLIHELIQEQDSTAEYILPIKNKSPDEIEQVIIQELHDWVSHHTQQFNLSELSAYKKKGWDWILVDAPVHVRYP